MLNNNFLLLLILLSPLALAFIATLAVYERRQLNQIKRGVTYASLVGLGLSALGIYFITQTPVIESSLLGYSDIGFRLRLDAVSLIMFSMISLIGFIVIRFSLNYLDGEKRQGVFLGRLSMTLAAVQLLVLSGNLFQIFVFWVLTSACLNELLVFYRERPQAIGAARKKFIVARIGDVCLLAASILIYLEIGSGDLSAIIDFVTVQKSLSNSLIGATVLLVLAAALKSAQFPTNGWLIEVVETPTPVSALLHAGLLNAGPFLMIRMSHLIAASSSASLILLIVGGITALLASVIFLTQPSIKVALGYSSIAHMGFSLMICGLGMYTAAMLHVVAHSFYKAHSFLSSGSVVDVLRIKKIKAPDRQGNIGKIALAVLASFGVFASVGYLWDVSLSTDFALLAVGAIIILGISQLLVVTMDSRGSFKSIFLSMMLSFLVTSSFFTLEHVAKIILLDQIPPVGMANPAVVVAIICILTMYAGVIVLQLLAPQIKKSEFIFRLGVHLRNGLYANIIFDRMVGSLKNEKFKWANLTIPESKENELHKVINSIETNPEIDTKSYAQ